MAVSGSLQAGQARSGTRAWAKRNRALLAALALSLLVHGLLLFLHRSVPPVNDIGGAAGANLPLSIRLGRPAPAVVVPPAPPAVRAPRPRRPAAPPVIATPAPSPRSVAPEPARAPPVPAPPTDMLSQVEAARRRRQEAEGTPAEPDGGAPSAGPSDDQRAMNNIQRNLRSLVPGSGREMGTSGVFQLVRLGYTSAEFSFYGWHNSFRRNINESVRVEVGADGDIRVAVVRRMIEIIRRYESADFTWESRRLGRVVSLSARPEDTAGLEEFLLREFFPEYYGAGVQR